MVARTGEKVPKSKREKPMATKRESPKVTRRMAKFDGPNPIDIHVGARLRLLRTIVGMSQTELAERVGLTFQAIQKYEHGDIRISASRLYELAIILGVSVSSFFVDLPDTASPEAGDKAPGETGTGETGTGEEIGGHSSLELLRTFSAIQDVELRRLFVQFLRRASLLPAGEPPDDSPTPPKTVTPIGRKKAV